MSQQQYLNTVQSRVKAIYVFTKQANINDAAGPRTKERKVFAVEYSDGNCSTYKFRDFPDFINLCIQNPDQYRLSFIDEVVTNNTEIIIQDGLVRFGEQGLKPSKINICSEVSATFAILVSQEVVPYPWHIFPSNIREIVALAQTILSTYPAAKICGLGQSLAWVVEAMQLVDPTKKYCHIPFSGSFFQPVDFDDTGNPNFVIREESYPKATRIENYQRNILATMCDPKEVVALYKVGTQTLIIEFINTGSGLVSFLKILYDFAKVKLEPGDYSVFQNAVKILVIDNDQGAGFELRKQVKFEEIDIVLETMKLPNNGVNLVWRLSNGVESGEFSERLVPSYRHDKWDDKPEKLDLLTPHIRGILSMLQSCVNKRKEFEEVSPNLIAASKSVDSEKQHIQQSLIFDAEAEPYIVQGYCLGNTEIWDF